MTATDPRPAVRPRAHSVDQIRALLSRDADGRPDFHRQLAHQFQLDALDRGQLHRFAAWPAEQPTGVLYSASGGTVMPAGDPGAGAALADAAQGDGWRVLVGPAPISNALIDASTRGLFRRRPRAREQRFMVCTEPSPLATPTGLRPARDDDLDALVDLACRLHVEDQMGPPIPESGRAAVRSRLHQSVRRGDTWVVERRSGVIAKVDVALRSPRRGAQIAGVYVHPQWRGQGVAAHAVAALTNRMLADELLGVTLHVRADNVAGRRAYERAGYLDVGAWTLALR